MSTVIDVERAVNPAIARSEWARGWSVVASAFTGNGVGFSLFLMTAGIFIIPLQRQFGLSRTAVMIGPAVGLATAFLTPFAATYVDRFGPRMAAVLGLAALTLSYLLLALMPATPVTFYSIAVIVALAGTVSSPMVYCKGVAAWFSRQAGIAFGVTMSGISVTTALAAPLLSHIVQTYGWRSGYFACAALVGAVGLPIVLAWFRERHQSAPRQTSIPERLGGSAAEALKSRKFWILMIVFACAGLSIGGIVSQLYPLLISQDFAPHSAAAAVSVYALSIGVGRVIGGYLLDRFSPSLIASMCLGLAALGAGVLLLVVSSAVPWYFAFGAAFLLGWGQGAEADFLAFFTQRLFGLSAFALIFSGFNLVAGGGLATGGLLFAFSYDVFGNYKIAMAVSVALWFAAAALIQMVRAPDKSTFTSTAELRN